jgi:hypothetical protein
MPVLRFKLTDLEAKSGKIGLGKQFWLLEKQTFLKCVAKGSSIKMQTDMNSENVLEWHPHICRVGTFPMQHGL